MPFLYLYNGVLNLISSDRAHNKDLFSKLSGRINKVEFILHEWSGYPVIRKKKINNTIAEFECGLKNQIESLLFFRNQSKSKLDLNFNLSIADLNDNYFELLHRENINLDFFEVHETNNSGMDLGGYAQVLKKKISGNPDELFFLINTSVSGFYGDKLEGYIEAFERYPQMGLLGISYSTKIYQTLIRNNFTPHVQSYFLVARSSALLALLQSNYNKFPGESETNKYALIRFGEAKITSLIQKLGFQVGVVEPDGEIHFLPKHEFCNNGYNSWKLPYGDRRLTNGLPNVVHHIKLNT
jgi:hypothetical protein